MEKIYAFLVDSVVFEIIPPFFNEEGKSVPLTDRYNQSIVDACVDITAVDPQPKEGWTFNGKKFAAPTPPPSDNLVSISNERDRLLTYASLRISPLQDAQDLGQITEVEAVALRAWKQYRVDLNRVTDQPSYPDNVVWPAQPD